MAAIIRLKRKASDEPLEALVIALKKKRTGLDQSKDVVLFKLGATVQSETESVHDHIQAALKKDADKTRRAEWGRNPKTLAQQSPIKKMQELHREDSKKKRFQLQNYHRLILAKSLPVNENDENESNGALKEELKELQKLYMLYDIIEETEDVKVKPVECNQDAMDTITCNGIPLVRTRTKDDKLESDYVYDVYYTHDVLDDRFVDDSVCLEPVFNLVLPEEEEPEEYYEDEDDSNEEDNWRNDYPDEDSDFERDHDYYRDYDYGDFKDSEDLEMLERFKAFDIDVDLDGYQLAEFKLRNMKPVEVEDLSD